MEYKIPDEKERFKQIKNDEGWEQSSEMIEITDFWPNFEKDKGKTLLGLFLSVVHLKRKKDGKPFDAYLIKTERKAVIAVKDYFIIKRELDKAKLGDGVKITYEGKVDKEKEEGFYHSFKVMLKKFEPDNESMIQGNTLVENDDPEAMNMIEHYKELYKHKNYDTEPNARNIITEMNNDEELSQEDKLRIKKQLAEMVKRKDIKK